jgi:hypothetical protein
MKRCRSGQEGLEEAASRRASGDSRDDNHPRSESTARRHARIYISSISDMGDALYFAA